MKNDNQLSVISNEFANNLLVSKSHVEDFNTKSQLIVYESQEALFYKDGQALDLFGPGRHSLNTENVPFLKRIFGALFGGKTPFPCDVFFINKVNVLDLLWGTDSPIVVEDPKYHLIVNVRANGQTGIHVIDSRRFVVKVVGLLPELSVDSVRRSIKGMMLSAIKETIAQTIVEQGVSILEVTTRLSTLGEAMQSRLNQRIADLGLAVDHFAINSIAGDENDLVKLREAKEKRLLAMNDAELEAYKMTVLSEARAKSRAMEGYTYQDERRFDVLEGAAKNEGGSAAFMNMGVGLGMGAGVGREVGRMTEQIAVAPAQAPAAAQSCPKCQAPIPAGARFCPGCGSPVEQGPRFCPQCGARCAQGSRFCSGCGAKLDNA